MNFDTAFIDMANVDIVVQEKDGSLFLKILPITYSDNRKPRLPRKTSTQTNLQGDTNHIFQHAFSSIKDDLNSIDRYKISIDVYKSTDRLGSGDLDNYCKAILDGVTSTKKIWADDKQVDEIKIKRYFITNSKYSYIELRISKL